MFKVIKSPWEDVFLNLLKDARTNIYLASPIIKFQTASLITQKVNHGLDFRYINSFKLAHFHTGVSDLAALRILKNENCRQKNIHNLHAKLFIIDRVAIVTSGNLTPGGLRNNLEYGILISDELVEEITQDYLTIFDNPEYPEITYSVIDKAEEILRSVPKEKRKAIKISENTLFNEIINDENIEERFDGGTESIIANLSPWKKDLFECLLKIKNDVFTLNEVYSFENDLSNLHPNNRNVKAKIRQQLQYLRNIGLLEFSSPPGRYKKLWT
jgi:phosphatidylserine/phosphatidylglycerophosphate/cardiolipin synthase-like enzyme